MSGNRSNPPPKKAASKKPAPKAGSQAGSKAGSKAGSQAGRKPKKTAGARVVTGVKWLAVVGLVLALVAAGTGFFAYRSTTIPDANKAFEAQTTFVYYDGGKSKIGRFAEQNRESIPLADIPASMQDAVIAAEDRTFYTNKGIDPKGIVRAAFSNAQGNATQGASTITQQYVKILYLSQERTLERKVKEAFLSLKVQQEKSKEAILEGYLNTIYFGRGAYGVQAAARAYFDKPAKKLTVQESAMLAAVINSPNYLSPDPREDGHGALVERYNYVLRSLVEMGNLDAGEADQYRDELPEVAKQRTSNMYGGQRGFMLTMVRDELRRLGFDDAQIEAGGLRVETTFTRKAMRASEKGVLAERPEGLKGLHVATASVDTASGALIGFYGGQNYLRSELNWAKLGGAPGSTFKPFALAAGLKAGFSLKDRFQGNSPYTYPDGRQVVNEGPGDGNDYGEAIDLVTATEQSVNTAYVDLTASIPDGPEQIVETAIDLGIPKDAPGLEANAGVALGSATISPIAMASAYASLANGGVHRDVFTVKKVSRAEDGEVLYRAQKRSDRVLSEDIAADVSYALQQVVKNGTGRNAQALGRPAAGKTGTATNKDDDVSSSWFVGYTPQVATAVMYVRGKGNEALNGFLPSYFGSNFPTMTWRAVMQGVMDGMEVEQFPPPANVDGDAPETGHEPYTPPPPPKPEPKPTKKAEPKPEPKPEPPPSQEPQPEPEPEPEPEPSKPPEPKPSESRSPKPKPKPSESRAPRCEKNNPDCG